jgi:hypothetical protein
VDYLRGLKENVIMGRLVPAGTGMEYYRQVKIAGEDYSIIELWPETLNSLRSSVPGGKTSLKTKRTISLIPSAALPGFGISA